MKPRFLCLLGLAVIGPSLAACGGTTINQSGSGESVCANNSSCGGATPGGTPTHRGGNSALSTTAGGPRASASDALGKLYREETYNHLGTKVFSNPEGYAAISGPASIPFGTWVKVKCWAPNESAMGSINAFYLVETSPWTGDYAPADTFLNADTSGSLDPNVPKC